jgi:hypothetical protein
VAEVKVEQNDVHRLLGEHLPGLVEIRRLDYAKTLELEIDPTQETNSGVIVDDEHRHAA